MEFFCSILLGILRFVIWVVCIMSFIGGFFFCWGFEVGGFWRGREESFRIFRWLVG